MAADPGDFLWQAGFFECLWELVQKGALLREYQIDEMRGMPAIARVCRPESDKKSVAYRERLTVLGQQNSLADSARDICSRTRKSY